MANLELLPLLAEIQTQAAARNYAQERETSLRQKLAVIRKRQSLQPEIQKLLEQTQQRMHQRTVGLFENLLTSLNQDVLKGDQTIRLLLEYGRGAPDLTLCAQRDADQEDIWDGNGGALTNVISTGLRVIALSRSGLRPFLLLDEADNWCAPEIVPRFFPVFEQLAETMGLQTFFVTHNDPASFGENTHVLRVVPVDKKTSTVRASPVTWGEDQPGIRWIRLMNVRLHLDSRLELAPGANALIGPNGRGKSTVASALRAVAYGEATSGLIRHGEDSCQVSMGLEAGQVLTWTRYRKASPKMRWVLQDAEGRVLHESTSAKGLPEWLEDTLKISRKEKLDIQLLHQKTPVFLLNEPGSKQAALLSVGQESEHLPELMQRYKTLVQTDTQTLRQGEEDLYQVLETLSRTAAIPALLQEGQRLAQFSKEIAEQRIRIEETALLSQTWERGLKVENQLGQGLALLGRLPALPTLHPTEDAERLGREWLQALSWQNTQIPEPVIVPPLRQLDGVQELIKTWAQTYAQAQTPIPADLPALPALRDLASLQETGKQWVAQQELLETLATQLKEAQSKEAVAAAELEGIWEQLGNCPVCGQPASHGQLLGERHGH